MPFGTSVKAVSKSVRAADRTASKRVRLFGAAGVRRVLNQGLSLLLASLLLVAATATQAGTIVRISTSVGDFSIELYDTTTPGTVQNFLRYVNGEVVDLNNDPVEASINYNRTYLHRTQDFDTQGIGIIQGGAFRFRPFIGPEQLIDPDTVPRVVNEPGISNSRGTIAMAKVAGDPDSASYQWFFNTADNSNPLDFDNGGFTVFGRVLGGADGSDREAGMGVLDIISGLPKFRPCGSGFPCPRADSAPIITEAYSGLPDEELVFVAMQVVNRYSAAVNVFNPLSGQVISSISVDGGVAAYSAKWTVLAEGNQVLLEAEADSVLLLRDAPEGAAVFTGATGKLNFPRLELNEAESFCNVEFQLADPATLRFALTGTPDSC